VGGYGNSGVTNSVDIYDAGLGFKPSWQPQIGTITSPVASGAVVVVTGTGFRGVSGGSGGNATQDSASDCPVLQVRSLEGGITVFPSSTNWSSTSLVSAPVNGLPVGYSLLTVFVNGIPGPSSFLLIDLPKALLTHPHQLGSGGFQFSFTNVPGADFVVLASTNLSLPSINWTILGPATEGLPGQFQFTDLQATNYPRRFYRLRLP
jgi:hypothetical protein